jgi:uncharacterized protein
MAGGQLISATNLAANQIQGKARPSGNGGDRMGERSRVRAVFGDLMRHWERNFFWVLILMVLVTLSYAAETIPLKPQGYVSDFARMMTPDTRERIEQLATQLKNEHQVELAVVTVETLGDRSIEDFATNLVAQWGIGQKGTNNGLLLLVSKNDRQMKIETGYGLEERVPDAVANQIISAIREKFRAGDYDGGLLTGAQMLTSAVGGTLQINRPARRTSARRGPDFGLWIFLLIIFVGILKSVFRTAMGRPAVRGGSSFPWWLIFLIGNGRGGGGSSWGGGGFSGGGGGFGGFGGGMSGGGGASGSW